MCVKVQIVQRQLARFEYEKGGGWVFDGSSEVEGLGEENWKFSK